MMGKQGVRSKSKVFIGLMSILGVALLAGCASASPGGNPSSTVKHLGSIVVATGPDASFANIVAAADKGFFAKYGIDATIKIYTSGGVATEAESTGEADITVSGQYS